MPRAKTILQSDYPYNVSARCINREWFSIPMEDVWAIFEEELIAVAKKFDLQIHSFVLMSNHFHMIASTPKANIAQCMHHLMFKASRRLTRAGNRINETFAGRHHKCILDHHNYYLNAYKYNYRNPVAAGICNNVEDYPFSTLQKVLGKKYSHFPLSEDLTYQSDISGTLNWLNTPPDSLKLEAVRYGLKRPFFTPKKNRADGKYILNPEDTI